MPCSRAHRTKESVIHAGQKSQPSTPDKRISHPQRTKEYDGNRQVNKNGVLTGTGKLIFHLVQISGELPPAPVGHVLALVVLNTRSMTFNKKICRACVFKILKLESNCNGLMGLFCSFVVVFFFNSLFRFYIALLIKCSFS